MYTYVQIGLGNTTKLVSGDKNGIKCTRNIIPSFHRVDPIKVTF